MKNGKQKNTGEGHSLLAPSPSLLFLLAVFLVAPQLTECLEEAKKGLESQVQIVYFIEAFCV